MEASKFFSHPVFFEIANLLSIDRSRTRSQRWQRLAHYLLDAFD